MQCSTKGKCGVCPGMWLSLVLLVGFAVYSFFIAPRPTQKAREANGVPQSTDARLSQAPPSAP